MLENPTLSARRSRVARALGLEREILVVAAGQPVPLPENTDQRYPFRAHAEYVYLGGIECAGGLIAFDPEEGPEAGWRSFVPEVTENERVWEGREQPPGEPLAAFDAWLTRRRGRPLALLGEPLRGVLPEPAVTERLRAALRHARRPKDGFEADLLRRAAAATAAGYEAVRGHIRPGVTERALQVELEAGFFRAGASRTGYGTIVAGGPNAAVLHFEPTARAVKPGEFVLIDAGGEVDRYVCDVSRTYVAGEPTAFQRDLHDLVRGTLERAVARCRPGAEWRDIHLGAAVDLMAGLVSMGIARGDPESLVERTAHRLFFPHGIGHMVGLGVRDASGMGPGRKPSTEPALENLRMDLALEPGYVVTVEPGLYFIRPLLEDPVRRERFKDAFAWDLVDRHSGLGGVRLEDNILVTESGEPEVLTAAIPRGL